MSLLELQIKYLTAPTKLFAKPHPEYKAYLNKSHSFNFYNWVDPHPWLNDSVKICAGCIIRDKK